MMENTIERLPTQVAEAAERAAKFVESPELVRALGEAAGNPDLWKQAVSDAERFLGSRGIGIPDGLGVNFLDDPFRGRPVPDYAFFSIRLIRCRTFWVRKKDGQGYEKVEVCFGFEIVPHPLPPIA